MCAQRHASAHTKLEFGVRPAETEEYTYTDTHESAHTIILMHRNVCIETCKRSHKVGIWDAACREGGGQRPKLKARAVWVGVILK